MKKKRSRRRKQLYRKIRRIISTVCIAIIILGILYFVQMGKEYAEDGALKSRLKELYYSNQSEIVPRDGETPQESIEGNLDLSISEEAADDNEDDVQAENGASEYNSGSSDSQEIATEPQESTVSEEGEIQVEEPVLQPEFEELYEENPDIVGWIKMGTSVDYPILWRDNTYYMNHDFDGNISDAGAIFLDQRNLPDMSDSAMLIYGHNMKNGSMFGDLDLYRGQEYFRQYPVISIQSAWESEIRHYVLISLFDASMNRSDPSYIKIVRTSFEYEENKEAFIQEMRERSMYKIDLDVTAQDQLLTLVTCSYTHDNGRFLLFARELREDETLEDVLEAFETMDLKK